MTASRDTLREGMADVIGGLPALAMGVSTTLGIALGDAGPRRIADALIAGPLAPILDKADSAEAAEARADRLSAEVEALREALTDVKFWIDTDLPTGTPRAGITHMRIVRALARAALAEQEKGR